MMSPVDALDVGWLIGFKFEFHSNTIPNGLVDATSSNLQQNLDEWLKCRH